LNEAEAIQLVEGTPIFSTLALVIITIAWALRGLQGDH